MRLSDWTEHAKTKNEAIEALKLAKDDFYDLEGTEAGMAMLNAAIGYFKSA